MGVLLRRRATRQLGAVEIAADEPHHLRRGIAEQARGMRSRAGQYVVDHDRGDRGDKAERGRQQGFGDAGRDDREIGRVRTSRCR